MRAPQPVKVKRFLGAVCVGFGAFGVLAPERYGKANGLTVVPGEYQYMTQLWGLRELALGGLILTACPSGDQSRILATAATLGAVEAVLSLRAPGLDQRQRVSAAVTAGGFGLAAVYAMRTRA